MEFLKGRIGSWLVWMAVTTMFVAITFLWVCRWNAPVLQSTIKDWTPQSRLTDVKRVLVIQSYHPEYAWTVATDRGLRKALPPTQGMDIRKVYMDTKRRPLNHDKWQAGQKVLAYIDSWNPHLVLAVDDDAQQFVTRHLRGQKARPVVFAGVNGQPEDYGWPLDHVTGVLERPHFSETIAFCKSILPDLQNIVVLSDSSLTTDRVFEFMKTQSSPVRVLRWVQAGTFAQWKAQVGWANANADALAIYTYHTVRKSPSDSMAMESAEVMAWTAQNANVPIIGFLTFAMDDGSLCGVLESGFEQGNRMGLIAQEILRGREPWRIPMAADLTGQTMLNLMAARKFGINIPDSLQRRISIVKGVQ